MPFLFQMSMESQFDHILSKILLFKQMGKKKKQQIQLIAADDSSRYV